MAAHAQGLRQQDHLKVGHTAQAGLDVGDRPSADVEALPGAAGRKVMGGKPTVISVITFIGGA